MTKMRVHDIAAEFGIESEQLIRLVGELDIHVRSHRAYDLSFLEKGPRQRVVIPEVRLLYFFSQFAEALFLFLYFKDNLLKH